MGTNNPDTIYGGLGDDEIEGWLSQIGSGSTGPVNDHDVIFGNAGHDYLQGGSGNDQLFGGTGNDDLDGGNGRDLLDGGAGNDDLFGVGTLFGGDGDDELYTDGFGATTLNGGAGNDHINLASSAGIVIDGGEGIDLLEVFGNADLTLSLADPNAVVVLPSGATITGMERLELTAFSGAYHITGGAYEDSIETHGDADFLNGGGGNDLIQAWGQNATLLGGDGDDSLEMNNAGGGASFADGGAGNDTLELSRSSSLLTFSFSLADPAVEVILADGTRITGIESLYFTSGSGADSITGGILGDTLSGGGGNDSLSGGTGNDQLIGGSGRDTLRGGEGDDLIYADFQTHEDQLFGGSGIDILVVNAEGQSAVTLSFEDSTLVQALWGTSQFTGFEGVSFNGSGGDDHVTGGLANDNFEDFGGNDTFIGGAGQDYFFDSTGQNELYGGDGHDFFEIGGSDSSSRVYGGAGVDVLYLYLDGETGITVSLARPGVMQLLGGGTRFKGIDLLDISAGQGDDNITGGAYGDTIYGAAGLDTLSGGAGNDEIRHESDSATLYGGGGDDVIIQSMSTPQGQNLTVIDGGNGIDLLDFNGGGEGTTAYVLSLADPSLVQVMADGMIITGIERMNFVGSAFADDLTGGALSDTLYGQQGRDTLRGGAGDDLIWGDDEFASGPASQLADKIYGNEGNDSLFGWGGSDQLYGGSGNDLLYGGLGDDILSGGAGRDTLVGDGGADVFLFTAPPATEDADVIGDFLTGVDRFLLTASAFGNPTSLTLPGAAFVRGTAAADNTDRFIFDSATGQVWYDADGARSGAQVIFALLDIGRDIRASDFEFV